MTCPSFGAIVIPFHSLLVHDTRADHGSEKLEHKEKHVHKAEGNVLTGRLRSMIQCSRVIAGWTRDM